MTIKETTAAIRKTQIELDNCNNHFRRVRLSDKLWDLRARYEMLMRQAGLEMVR